MVHNFGEKRKKKNNKNKTRGKAAKGGKEMGEVTCREVAIYVPPDQREADDRKYKQTYTRPSKPKNTYRSKREERQRVKKDRKSFRGSYNRDDYTDEEEDEDDLDFGGEYDEIIRTGPTRREFEQMTSSSIGFSGLGTRYGRNERTRRGHSGHSRHTGYGGHGSQMFEDLSMLDLLIMAMGSRFGL